MKVLGAKPHERCAPELVQQMNRFKPFASKSFELHESTESVHDDFASHPHQMPNVPRRGTIDIAEYKPMALVRHRHLAWWQRSFGAVASGGVPFVGGGGTVGERELFQLLTPQQSRDRSMSTPPTTISKLTDHIEKLCQGSDVGIWWMVVEIRDAIPGLSESEVVETTLDVVRALIPRGIVPVDMVGGGVCIAWQGTVENVAGRIQREWDRLGRDPVIGDIGWFVPRERAAPFRV